MAIIKARKLSFSWVAALWNAVDIRDFFVFGGLGMLGYGLYLLYPWLGWAVVGAVSMLLGLGWIVRRPGE